MRNRFRSDDWWEAFDNAARIALMILIIGGACSLVLGSAMLSFKLIFG